MGVTTWTGPKNQQHAVKKEAAKLSLPASECSGLMDMTQKHACNPMVLTHGKTQNAALKKEWDPAPMTTSTSRVREVATMVEMIQSTTPTAPRSAKESNFSDAVCQSSTDSSVSRRVIRESTQNTMSTWRPSG